MNPSDVDREFAEEVVGRARLLSVVREQPRTLQELESRLPTSRSTIHRTTQSLVEAGILSKSGRTFELTGTGVVVTRAIDALYGKLTGARHLEPFLNTLGRTDVDVPVEHFLGASVARPRPHQAHFAANNIANLIEGTDSLRMFSSIISPFYVDIAHREMMNGTEITVIFDERVIETILTEYREQAVEALETGRFEVYVAPDVPFELFLFDDRMGMAAHDDNALARAFVETSSEDALDWANDLYERYLSRAERVTLD